MYLIFKKIDNYYNIYYVILLFYLVMDFELKSPYAILHSKEGDVMYNIVFDSS